MSLFFDWGYLGNTVYPYRLHLLVLKIKLTRGLQNGSTPAHIPCPSPASPKLVSVGSDRAQSTLRVGGTPLLLELHVENHVHLGAILERCLSCLDVAPDFLIETPATTKCVVAHGSFCDVVLYREDLVGQVGELRIGEDVETLSEPNVFLVCVVVALLEAEDLLNGRDASQRELSVASKGLDIGSFRLLAGMSLKR